MSNIGKFPVTYGSRCLLAALRKIETNDQPHTDKSVAPTLSSRDCGLLEIGTSTFEGSTFEELINANESETFNLSLLDNSDLFCQTDEETFPPFENPVLAELQPQDQVQPPVLTELQPIYEIRPETFDELIPLNLPLQAAELVESQEQVSEDDASSQSENDDAFVVQHSNLDSLETNNVELSSPESDLANVEIQQENGEELPKKRKRNLKAHPETWKRNVEKAKRMRGKAYNGRLYSTTEKKSKEVSKEALHLGARCGGKICDNQESKTVHCRKISDQARQQLFDRFWKETDWDQRRTYVSAMVDVVERKEVKQGENSRRSCSLQYHLKVGDERIRVCAIMFQNTLKIPHRTILHWLGKGKDGMVKTSKYSSKQDRTKGKNANDKERVRIANMFVDKLNKVPSHYCRQSTTKKYLWPYDFKNATDVHNKYCKWIKENHPYHQPVSLTIFKSILKKKNIEIWQPKKDQCDTCIAYKQGNVTEEVHLEHLDLKNEARKEKEKDKEEAKKSVNEMLMLTVDVQAVQNIPKLQASCLYFKTKLNLHNYTVYNNGTQDVVCYVWPETSAGLTASVFASCLLNYFDDQVTEHPKLRKIVIWSDGCGAQNRNATLLSAVSSWAQQHSKEVFFKYLEKGHTQMEVDSVHAKIESKQKNVDLETPADYCRIVREARQKPHPFKCKYLEYDFFTNFEATQTYVSVRPGTKKGDPCVVDVKEFLCSTEGKIKYKLDHERKSEYQLLPRAHRRKNQPEGPEPPRALYANPLPITERKYKDLQDMKYVVHPNHHQYYDSLPHL